MLHGADWVEASSELETLIGLLNFAGFVGGGLLSYSIV